jgi:thiosulfate reductase cytochrome b subunit
MAVDHPVAMTDWTVVGSALLLACWFGFLLFLLISPHIWRRASISSRRGASSEPNSFAFSYQRRADGTSGTTP